MNLEKINQLSILNDKEKEEVKNFLNKSLENKKLQEEEDFFRLNKK